MADEAMKKGVVIEFDFTALDGAGILHDTTAKILADGEIPFDTTAEARYLAGGNLQGALTEYFAVVKTKKTPQKAAKDITDAFRSALNEAVPAALTPEFKAFVKALVDKGLTVVISTRADVEVVRPAFADMLSDSVILHQETSVTYGNVKWDAWKRAAVSNQLRNFLTVAVTGSGNGVKSALLAGMGSIAVINDRVAYQDFGGADYVVDKLDMSVAQKLFSMLKVR